MSKERALEKLGGRFGSCVRVTYVPVDDEERRDRVIIDLVKLSARYEGGMTSSKTVGRLSKSYQLSSNDYQTEREHILASLASGQRNIA